MNINGLRKAIADRAKSVTIEPVLEDSAAYFKIQPDGILRTELEHVFSQQLPDQWRYMRIDDKTWAVYEQYGSVDDPLTKRDLLREHEDGTLTTIVVQPDERCGDIEQIDNSHPPDINYDTCL